MRQGTLAFGSVAHSASPRGWAGCFSLVGLERYRWSPRLPILGLMKAGRADVCACMARMAACFGKRGKHEVRMQCRNAGIDAHAPAGALHLINRSAVASQVLVQSGEGARPIHYKLYTTAASADTQTPIQTCRADLLFPTTSSLVTFMVLQQDVASRCLLVLELEYRKERGKEG